MTNQQTMVAILQPGDPINRVSPLKATGELSERTLLYDYQRDNSDLAAGRTILIREDGSREVKGRK